MMLALVLIVATDSAATPVSAIPRSLSDYALEHRLLRGARKEPGAAGGFSAAESTLPREPYLVLPAVEEERPEPPEPAVVVVPPAYGPVWLGDGGGGGRRQTNGRIHGRTAFRATAPRLAPPPLARPSAPLPHQARIAGGGRAARP